jgi:hypothetical protein
MYIFLVLGAWIPGSQGSVVSAVGAVGCSNPCVAKWIVSPQHGQSCSGVHPPPNSMGVWLFTLNKPARKWANQSPPFSVKVKNEWSFTSTHPLRYRGMYKGNFIFTHENLSI